MTDTLKKQIQAMRAHVHQLANAEASPLDAEQTEDTQNILNALDLIENRLPLLETLSETDVDRMQILHDLTSPINGIIGYLFILKQGYTSPLNCRQQTLVKSMETQIHEIHQYLTEYITSPQIDT